MPISPPANAKKVFSGEIMEFWQWEQPLFDGKTATFECVTRPDTTTIIPFFEDGTVLLTKQEQPHKPEPFYDFPGGRIDPGEDSLHAVRRELKEETGCTVRSEMLWMEIPQRSLNRFSQFFYIGKGCEQQAEPHVDGGERIETMRLPWEEVVRYCLEGRLRQPHLMLAVLQMEYHPASRDRLREWLKSA